MNNFDYEFMESSDHYQRFEDIHVPAPVTRLHTWLFELEEVTADELARKYARANQDTYARLLEQNIKIAYAN